MYNKCTVKICSIFEDDRPFKFEKLFWNEKITFVSFTTPCFVTQHGMGFKGFSLKVLIVLLCNSYLRNEVTGLTNVHQSK